MALNIPPVLGRIECRRRISAMLRHFKNLGSTPKMTGALRLLADYVPFPI